MSFQDELIQLRGTRTGDFIPFGFVVRDLFDRQFGDSGFVVITTVALTILGVVLLRTPGCLFVKFRRGQDEVAWGLFIVIGQMHENPEVSQDILS